jgi:hypothetical protein
MTTLPCGASHYVKFLGEGIQRTLIRVAQHLGSGCAKVKAESEKNLMPSRPTGR